jgi:hypothetical protein
VVEHGDILLKLAPAMGTPELMVAAVVALRMIIIILRAEEAAVLGGR